MNLGAWETLGQHDDAELLKMFHLDYQDGYHLKKKFKQYLLNTISQILPKLSGSRPLVKSV